MIKALKNTPPILAIVLLVLIVYFIGKRLGRLKQQNTTIPDIKLPTGETWNPEPLAAELFNSMDGVQWTENGRIEVWQKLLYIGTDTQFIAVNNAYNSKYAQQGSSLRKDINGEFLIDFTGTKTKLNDRFSRLNIS